MVGVNTDLHSQLALLSEILRQSEAIWVALSRAQSLGLPDYYIGAGCIAQTVWNHHTGAEATHGISDMDFVYYDNSDLSFEAEGAMIARITDALAPCPLPLDIKNQARVHLWYPQHFGCGIAPYPSLESAVNTWPTTATAVGVRLENNQLKVYAPFGLNDLFGMVVRANKAQITEAIYLQKVQKWRAKWPMLSVVPW